ncbi:filamentation induced by cAMP protein Fic [Cystobacter fuscus DSM 2262]|uniref:Filamentation induced by cAMP protein Fic n=1 Tax=Cystobacter fuscus (strain ATCC 25194 / DSM 2262 / NBRC 100088 / M29) TaxID=1242864 RepID=S9NZR5_CYSF2|nr:Fic family protein [Cystobacter fuscus]EPX55512.1 filamentation induced by cAMP protein Fic [Cystobacter fuscus DSM 2262]
MKERYQEIDEKNEALRDYLGIYKDKGRDFLERFEMSWIYHDAALEGTVYTQQELVSALFPERSTMDPAMIPVVLEVRNHKAACDYLREEAAATGKKQAQITLTTIKRIHDLLCGNTPEALATRANIERRDRTEKELAKERERSGYRKDMPLHRTYFHEIAQPAKIQPGLEKLVDYTASAEFREFHPIKQAAVVQHRFMQVFPFTENSGKVGRMLTNLVLLRHGYMPAIIHSIDRQRYYESLRGAEGLFRTLLMDAIENSLDNGIKYFKDMARRYKAIN